MAPKKAPGVETPSEDIGWCYGFPKDGNRHKVECLLCGKIVSGGITRFKQHLAAQRGDVEACPGADSTVRKEMAAYLKNAKEKKLEKQQIKEELQQRLRPGGDDVDSDDEDNDEERDMAYARNESLREQREYEENMRFRASAGTRYDAGGSSGAALRKSSTIRETGVHGGSSRKWSDPDNPETRLRAMNPAISRSKSSKQPKIKQSFVKKAKEKLRDAWGNFIVYNRLPFSVVSSPWAQPLIDTAIEVGRGVKNPSPYDISETFINSEADKMQQYIDSFKGIWKERGVTIMCDGWTGPTRKHIINFLVYCNRGTVFMWSCDASDVPSRTGDFYFRLMDRMVEMVGEENVVQIVTDNEAAMKAGGQLLMEKRKHLYWTACAAHCIDLILEDIGKKTSVSRVITEAKTITGFIYNHTWVLDFMKQFTNGGELLRTSITRFATNFIAIESIVRYKTELKNMIKSDGWKNSVWGKKKNGPAYDIKEIILSKYFFAKSS